VLINFSSECKTCKVLENQLAAERDEKNKLLKLVMEMSRPAVVEESRINIEEFKPINSDQSWRSLRAKLEADSAKEASRLNNERLEAEKRKEIEKLERDISIEKLEKELGVEHAS
jgi:hypothetical protein